MKSDLSRLVELCKACVSIEINDHKNIYCSVAEYMNDLPHSDFLDDIEPDVLAKMIELDTIVDLHFYPDTPIGFHKIFHYDVDMAIEDAIKIIEDEYFI